MSWIDDFRSGELLPWRLSRQLQASWGALRTDGMTRSQSAAFLGLRLVQRVSFWVGYTVEDMKEDMKEDMNRSRNSRPGP